MEANAANWLALWIARSAATLELAHGQRAGANVEASIASERALASSIETMREAAADTVPACFLRTRLDLSDTEERVLWILIAADLSSDVRERAILLSGCAEPTVTMLLEAVYGATTSVLGWSELAPTAQLRSLGLVLRSDSSDERVPEPRQTLRASARAREIALGQIGIPDELSELMKLDSEGLELSDIIVGDRTRQQVAELVTRPNALLLVTGTKGIGKATLVRAAARAAGAAVLEVDATRLAPTRTAAKAQLDSAMREARLHDAAILVSNIDSLAADGTSAEDRLDLLDSQLLRNANQPVYVTATARPNGMKSRRAVISVEVPPLTAAQRETLWKRAIPTASAADGEFLASTYPMSPAVIFDVGRALRARCDGRPKADEVLSAIDGVVDDHLRGLADRVRVTQTWHDLVLPAEQLAPVQEIVARVRKRREVYETWGFANKLGKGLGVTALLSGAPGTGKTMLAGLIANELGLALYQVDLSKMVSKWIGETEKNLARLFDAAEAGHAVLLFDEADSMFGKRTDVRSSNDRNANLEVNYLLQRIERFTGICILTSNHESAIDPAFRRRLAFHVRFDTPDEAERELLWRTQVPSGAPLANDIDYAALARKFDMAGGHIRNAVLRAAFLASEAGTSISMTHLWRSALNEYESMGKISHNSLS